ncbi:MAG TPA: prolyl oligopeptidase family serine peptidase [Vicinamibacterales bacterium]|nr:prolyl oligopeptidase family serine peptidase [Vicinamibacterales bacterium]
MHLSRSRAATTRIVIVALVLVVGERAAPRVRTAAGGTFDLTVDSIMRGPRLVGYPQTGLRWSGDSSRLYFEWRRPADEEAATYVVPKDGGEPHKLSDEERRVAPPPSGVWDRAHRRVLFVDDGDIALVDTVAGTRRQITRTIGNEGNPRWARKESAVTFTRDNNLFIVPVDAGAPNVVGGAGGPGGPGGPGGIVQLTDVTSRKREPRETDSQKFVKAEEQKLIEHTRVEAEKKKKAEEKEKKLALPKYELAERQSAQDLQLSPDGKHVFITIVERAESAKRPAVPNYVTESSYTEDIPARTFVGDAQDKRTLVVMNLETATSQVVDASFADKRDVRWSMPQLSEDGSLAVATVRAHDNKDRWLVAVDAETGKSRVVDALHDDAWVREFGGFGPDASFGFLADQRHLWFLSERDGWMHLYTIDAAAAGATARQLTQGKWEITDIALSGDRKKFYITSTEVHPGERHLYAMPIEGGDRTKLTSMPGGNAGDVSPDDSTIGLVYSFSNKPHEVYVMPNRPGASAKQMTTTPTDEWRSFKWIDPQLVTYKTRDGVDVYARLFTPEMAGAKRDPAAPAVVFVHGAGYAQNAHRYWASYYREYMFHNLLASRGYVVLDPDYRASSGYGRDWRTAIYRHMGGHDLDDVVDGARFLVEKQRVNAKRIGVYGGSYGGFITLMAMFTSPDTFAAGAALRPVTDWSHYNHGYTSNILNEPQTDPDAYRKSSPIYFAEGLKGHLLILHGMVDTNVLFQDSVRLVQRLIELRKENWSIAPFPVENHGFEEETSWADEYKRILKLFDDQLKLPGRAGHTGNHDSRRAS